jgi:hypothetical protein
MISWNLQMSVRDGRLNDARELMSEMVAGTREEPGTQGYEWFLRHLGNFGSKFAERFLECFEPTSLSVYGEPSAEARAALDGLGAAYLGWLGGFVR